MTLRMRTAISWIMTIAVAAAVIGTIVSAHTTTSHRAWSAAWMGFMVLYNGWVWSTIHVNAVEHTHAQPVVND